MPKFDILQPCRKETLNEFLKILRKQLPQQIRARNTIYNYWYHYERINQERKSLKSGRWNVTFFQPKNANIENCTLISISGVKDYTIGLFTIQNSCEELVNSLQRTKLIQWDHPCIQLMCEDKHFEAVEKIFTAKSTNWIYLPSECIMHADEAAIKNFPTLSLPNDVCIALLDGDRHAGIINDNWPYKTENSLELIRASILFNGGIGLFHKNNREQPFGWTCTNEFLTPGFLYIEPSQRSKGYGKLLLLNEVKRVYQQHHLNMYSYVSNDNLISMKVHEQIGFVKVNALTWILNNNQNNTETNY